MSKGSKHRIGQRHWLAFILLIVIILPGCRSAWPVTLIDAQGVSVVINRRVLEDLREFWGESEDPDGIPLEWVLYDVGGYHVIEELRVTDDLGILQRYPWPSVADRAWWLRDGTLKLGEQNVTAVQLEADSPALWGQVQAQVTDIAPTIATALGVPIPEDATGDVLETFVSSQVLMLFLDGFGYVRYTEALAEDLIPNLATLAPPLIGVSVYPPCTAVASASVLTGAPPQVHGATQRNIRKTETQTLFDVLADAGRRVVAIEGNALSFNLRNAELQLSGDRDGNGGTDDNVLANTLAVLEEEGMPDLLWVHFHGIDDAGHTYGPGGAEEEAKIREVDAAVARVIQAVPEGTLVVIFADHGMHSVIEEGRLGNHGHLISRDMFIPIFIVRRTAEN